MSEHLILRCFECKMVLIVKQPKNGNKWNCRSCSTRQSIIKVFARGVPKELRGVISDIRQNLDENERNENFLQDENSQKIKNSQENKELDDDINIRPKESKWCKYEDGIRPESPILETRDTEEILNLFNDSKEECEVKNEFSMISNIRIDSSSQHIVKKEVLNKTSGNKKRKIEIQNDQEISLKSKKKKTNLTPANTNTDMQFKFEEIKTDNSRWDKF